MFTYENGLLLSFLLYCYYVISLVVTINSQAEKNLNKVGERYSWLSLKPTLMSHSDFDRPFIKSVGKFIFVISLHGLFVFLSWINVLANVVNIIYNYAKDSGAPQAVKDFRWKMRNYDMTFDEIVLELMKMKGISEDQFEDVKAELIEFVEQRRMK